MQKETLVINLFGGPGVGKSTTAAWLFSQLKMDGVDCEYVSEFAKDKVWEKNDEVFKCQFYITGKQIFKINRCISKVDVVITDSPILLGIFYDTDNGPDFKKAVLYQFQKYKNLNFFLERKYAYQENGRNQTEDEAKEVDRIIKLGLEEANINYISAPDKEFILEEIKRRI